MTKKVQRYCKCGNPVFNRKRKCDECKERDALPKEKKCKSCDTMITGRSAKCQECKDKEAEAKRNKICSICGESFRLEDHQNASVKVCPRCKDAKYRMAFETIMLYFSIGNPLYYLNTKDQIRGFASMQRNIIQAVSMFPEFKLSHIKFVSVPKSSQTFDHINTMTFFIENYIRACRLDPRKKSYEYFRKYLLKYAVQFRVTPQQNMDLVKFQTTGITPEQYISVVGPIEGKSEVESIDSIREHFICG